MCNHLRIDRLFVRGAPAGSAGEEAAAALRQRRRVEALIQICWGIIVFKSLAVVWAVQHYRIPFSPFWVIGPTVGFAALATAAYYYLRD